MLACAHRKMIKKAACDGVLADIERQSARDHVWQGKDIVIYGSETKQVKAESFRKTARRA